MTIALVLKCDECGKDIIRMDDTLSTVRLRYQAKEMGIAAVRDKKDLCFYCYWSWRQNKMRKVSSTIKALV